jgi:hypothetical protein
MPRHPLPECVKCRRAMNFDGDTGKFVCLKCTVTDGRGEPPRSSGPIKAKAPSGERGLLQSWGRGLGDHPR